MFALSVFDDAKAENFSRTYRLPRAQGVSAVLRMPSEGWRPWTFLQTFGLLFAPFLS